MMAAMNHRGPDDRGLYQDAQVVLGMTRLAIIDPSPDAHQPMSNPDQTIWIVYNGEVYNFQSERRLLEAHDYKFSSSSDTEVVLRMYEHYGDEFLNRLRGMFALAIYDKRRGPGHERLLLARDYFGIKPLLYARHGSHFIFASELKALLASGLVQREIDPIGLRLLLSYGHVSQPRTILRGASMLPPSHYLVIEPSRECLRRYWSLHLDRRATLRTNSYPEIVAEVETVLRESVRLHLVSDAPVGAFLSGGIDSSLLTALITQSSHPQLKTFSISFGAEGAGFDESETARKVAELLGTNHTTMLLDGENVRDRIQDIAFSLDQPSIDGVNTYFVSLAASQAVKVAISGLGGDELFAGYSWFIQMLFKRKSERDQPWTTLAKNMLARIANRPVFDSLSLARNGANLLSRVRNCAGFLNHYNKFNSPVFGPSETSRLLLPEIRRRAQAGRSPEVDQKLFDELPNGSTIERVTGLCLSGYMSNQLLRDVDAVSMAHSLEVRVPFLDRVVVDTALSLPDYAKLNDASELDKSGPYSYRKSGIKRILMDIGRPFLPKDFDVQPKRGFQLPFGAWMKGSLKDVLHETLSETQTRARQLLDPQEVSAVKQHFLAAPTDDRRAWVKPWILIILELWCREVLDGSQTRLG
jgi:asparagine synthase (glutamine-hydrolysing)